MNPVILDTDIGTDIDDTWALGFLLACPELDVKLITTTSDDTEYRAKIVAKFLEAMDRTDIPVAMGTRESENWGPQAAWVQDYDLKKYAGKVTPNAPKEIIDVIMNSRRQITIISIGPLSTVANALELAPNIVKNARFIGMHGSVYKGYNGSSIPSPEYNVVRDIDSCKRVFDAPWDVLVTPLDTCGLIKLKGQNYKDLDKRENLITKLIMENYEIWHWSTNASKNFDIHYESSILFDTISICTAFTEKYVQIEEIGIIVDENGFTKPSTEGKVIRCATSWRDLSGFKSFLVKRLMDKCW